MRIDKKIKKNNNYNQPNLKLEEIKAKALAKMKEKPEQKKDYPELELTSESKT